MTIPSSGGFSVATVNTDMTRTITNALTLGSDAFRALCRKMTGALSMGDARGRSASGRYVSPVLTRPTAGISAGGGGDSCAITPDGATFVLANSYDRKFSAPSWQGAAYIYKYNKSTDVWVGPSVVGCTLGTNSFGVREQSVAINSAGTRIVIGADGIGFTTISWDGSAWSQAGTIPGNGVGYSVSLSDDGNTMAISNPYEVGTPTTYTQGAVYVYIWTGSAWSLQQKIKPSATISYNYSFGRSVSLSSDGDTLFVFDNQDRCGTASIKGSVYVYTRVSEVWSQQAYIPAYPTNASAFALWTRRDAAEFVLATPSDLSVYRKATGTWTKVQSISAPASKVATAQFAGNSVSISTDGKYMLVVDGYDYTYGAVSKAHSYAKDNSGNWFYQGTFPTTPSSIGQGRINSDGSVGVVSSGSWYSFVGYIFDK